MTVARRILYLGYYAREMKWNLLFRFMRHVSEIRGIGRFRQTLSFLSDSLRHNISPLEWYQFGFYDLPEAEKSTWAGTGAMYEFQLRANPASTRTLLDDKRLFFEAYRKFFRHDVYSEDQLKADRKLCAHLLRDNRALVVKAANGKCGDSVEFIDTAELDSDQLLELMRTRNKQLLETPIAQHPELARLSASGVNTVRIITLLDNDGIPRLLGCRLRISIDSRVDNLAAGNIVAAVDESSGRVTGAGFYSDITRPPVEIHPVTGIRIDGFKIPFWCDCIDLAREAAMLHPENRSIGWDIAVTENGPGLIEGNHDWCKLVWQLPAGRGLISLLQK